MKDTTKKLSKSIFLHTEEQVGMVSGYHLKALLQNCPDCTLRTVSSCSVVHSLRHMSTQKRSGKRQGFQQSPLLSSDFNEEDRRKRCKQNLSRFNYDTSFLLFFCVSVSQVPQALAEEIMLYTPRSLTRLICSVPLWNSPWGGWKKKKKEKSAIAFFQSMQVLIWSFRVLLSLNSQPKEEMRCSHFKLSITNIHSHFWCVCVSTKSRGIT